MRVNNVVKPEASVLSRDSDTDQNKGLKFQDKHKILTRIVLAIRYRESLISIAVNDHIQKVKSHLSYKEKSHH
ncbi:hypothetical protein IMY05_012G0051700 [Salix suchowensis]|nr:hypothetical protein IMY05_012G0051700 [Salix suchowensis]